MKNSLFVMDTNCRPGFETRVHSVALENGGFADYTFKMNEKTEMPEGHAMKFLKDEAWIVTDHNGNRVRPIEEVKAGEAIPLLGGDKVVAYWDELTASALLTRAQMRRGGEKFSKTTKKADLIWFLKSDAEIKAKADDSIPADEGDGLVDGELSTAALNVMLGDDAQIGDGDGIGEAEAG